MRRIPGIAIYGRIIGRAAVLHVLLAFVVLVITPAAARESGFTQGLIWRIETPGAAPSFLFGTMHSADPAVAKPVERS